MAWLDPIVGREQGGRRPVLIVSSDQFNSLPHNLSVVVPLTRTNRHIPTHIPVASGEGGLTFDSVIMCDQIRSISIERLQARLGIINDLTLSRVMTVLHRILPETDIPVN
jgi:mRNA interferase MazF